ncbi:MAG: hypothetical protein JKY37_23845, partial [Nannocystaceae bacterium]|nr:hypothetical protein [Nannocystaceae bacterium]
MSVGATTHFVLRPTNFATEVIDMTETVDWGGSATDIHWEWRGKPDPGGGAEPRRTLHVEAKLHSFEALSGTVSHSVTWDNPGDWTVIARVQRTGVIYQCELSVLPRSEIIGWSKAWPENQADPHAAAQWGRQTLGLMDEFMGLLVLTGRAMDEATARRHATQRLQLSQYLDGLEKLLIGVPHSQLSFIRGVWVARTVDDVADDLVAVRVILYKTVHPGQRPRWHLVDWTNPTSSRALAVHVGQMMDDASSIKAAIASWETSNQYPAGTIEFEVDGMAGYHLVRAYDDPAARNLTITTTDDFALRTADILGWLSMGTFVLALVAIATGIGSVAAPALLAVSAATGAGSGAAHIVYLINAGNDSWRAYALDALSIAGNLLGLRGGAFKLMGTAPIKIGAAKTTKYVVMGEMMTNGAELMLVAESTHTQLGKLADDPTKTPQEKIEEATKLVSVAIGTSALLVWSVRQNATDLKNIDNFLKSAIDPDPSWRGHIESGKDPAEVQDVVVHNAKRVPDQALLYRDVRELRV